MRMRETTESARKDHDAQDQDDGEFDRHRTPIVHDHDHLKV